MFMIFSLSVAGLGEESQTSTDTSLTRNILVNKGSLAMGSSPSASGFEGGKRSTWKLVVGNDRLCKERENTLTAAGMISMHRENIHQQV